VATSYGPTQSVAVVQQELQGFGLPVYSLGGYFAVKNQYQIAWSDFLMAIMTPLTGRAMNRSFGSALSRTVFDPRSLSTNQQAMTAIRAAAARWCPHIVINAINTQSQQNKIQLLVNFSLASNRAVSVQGQTPFILIPDFIQILGAIQ